MSSMLSLTINKLYWVIKYEKEEKLLYITKH